MQVESPGKSMNCYRVVPSAQQNFKDTPALAELSLHNKEDLLAKAVELPEDIFLKIADVIFETQQNELIPALIAIMENHPTPKTIDLLKETSAESRSSSRTQLLQSRPVPFEAGGPLWR